jgi:ProP effector
MARHKHTPEEIAGAEELIAQLAERWPRAFFVFERRRRPLAIGIHADLLPAVDATPALLELALRRYVGNDFYLHALRPGAQRLNLDGHVVATVTEAEAAFAARVRKKRAIRKERSKQAAPTPAPTAAAPKRLGLADLKAAAQARKQKAMEQGEAA